MRPYRGLTKDGKWVYGWYFKRCQGETIVDGVIQKVFIDVILPEGEYHSVEVIPETVGQYAGLKDKKGKAQNIYADDVLESADGLRKYRVAWNDRAGRWYLRGLGKARCNNQPDWDNYIETGLNIHENPELLEEPVK